MIADRLYWLARPALRAIDAEMAHRLAIRALASGLLPVRREPGDPILATRVWGLDLPNALGLAAGFDKNGETGNAAFNLGFGHVEIGTVTPRPQPGNPRPRLFRLTSDRAVINRYGFNSDGLEAMLDRLESRRAEPRAGLLGINLGKNKDVADEVSDFVTGVEAVCRFADYLVINVSSPNTPGLRDLQARAAMERLVQAVLDARERTVPAGGKRPPLLVKLAPDLDDAGLADAAEVALVTGIDGLIMGNTTISRPPGLTARHAGQGGGLSGRPLLALSTRRLADLYRLTAGAVPLIGAGGVSSGADAYAKIRAGASLVQVYTALVFEGPGLAARINRELAALLRHDGFSSAAEAVGADHRPEGDVARA